MGNWRRADQQIRFIVRLQRSGCEYYFHCISSHRFGLNRPGLARPDAFTELEDFDQLLDEVTRVLLGSVCIGVAAQSKLENQTAVSYGRRS